MLKFDNLFFIIGNTKYADTIFVYNVCKGGDEMNILEELWYGNIHPGERPIRKGSEYARIFCKVAEEKEKLKPNLPTRCQENLESLMDLQLEATATAEKDAFLLGFHLATKILVEGLAESW